jgi:hypothetical protein
MFFFPFVVEHYVQNAEQNNGDKKHAHSDELGFHEPLAALNHDSPNRKCAAAGA